MKKATIFLFMLFLSAGHTYAQWKFSAIAGPSVTTFYGSDKKDWGGVGENPKIVFRFHIGLLAEYPINENLSLTGGVRFASKGAMYKGEAEYYDQQSQEFSMITVKYSKMLNYIDIPIYVTYMKSPKWNFIAGLQPGILISAKVKNDENAQKAYDLPEKEDVKDYYSTLDLAILLGPQYRLNENIAVRILFKPGILKIAKGEEYDMNGGMEETKYKVMNTGFDFSFIYTFNQ